jgi:hypothetical protein
VLFKAGAIVVHISDRGKALLPASDARAGKGKRRTRTGMWLYPWSEYKGRRGVPLAAIAAMSNLSRKTFTRSFRASPDRHVGVDWLRLPVPRPQLIVPSTYPRFGLRALRRA